MSVTHKGEQLIKEYQTQNKPQRLTGGRKNNKMIFF